MARLTWVGSRGSRLFANTEPRRARTELLGVARSVRICTSRKNEVSGPGGLVRDGITFFGDPPPFDLQSAKDPLRGQVHIDKSDTTLAPLRLVVTCKEMYLRRVEAVSVVIPVKS